MDEALRSLLATLALPEFGLSTVFIVAVVSATESSVLVAAALKAGAAGYIPKTSTPNLDRARKLVELAGSPNENEARNAAVQACRMIREQGIRLASDNPLVSSDPLDLALRELHDAAVRAGVAL